MIISKAHKKVTDSETLGDVPGEVVRVSGGKYKAHFCNGAVKNCPADSLRLIPAKKLQAALSSR